MKKFTEQMKISPKSMKTIVKTDIKHSPNKMPKHQHLIDLQKQKRADRTQLLLNFMKDGTQGREMVFSDEELFTVRAQFNSQNGRFLAKHPEDSP